MQATCMMKKYKVTMNSRTTNRSACTKNKKSKTKRKTRNKMKMIWKKEKLKTMIIKVLIRIIIKGRIPMLISHNIVLIKIIMSKSKRISILISINHHICPIMVGSRAGKKRSQISTLMLLNK